MERKAIQLAKNTLVISLPSAWAKKNKITKGATLTIDDQGASLRIRCDGKLPALTASLDARELSERTVRWAVSSLHKQGIDELEILYTDAKTVGVIEELVRDLLLGFAIVSQKEKRLVLKQVARDAHDQFDVVLRRAFLVTMSLAEGVSDAIERSDSHDLKSAALLERTNNQLTNFCMRLINRGEGVAELQTFWYVILWNLEKVADEYKDLVGDADAQKIACCKEQKMLLRDVAALVRGYYDAFYDGNIKDLDVLAKSRKELLTKAMKYCAESQGFDALVAHRMANVLSKVGDFSASFMAVRKSF